MHQNCIGGCFKCISNQSENFSPENTFIRRINRPIQLLEGVPPIPMCCISITVDTSLLLYLPKRAIRFFMLSTPICIGHAKSTRYTFIFRLRLIRLGVTSSRAKGTCLAWYEARSLHRAIHVTSAESSGKEVRVKEPHPT